MTPEAQRIAIAEACGWTGIRMSKRWEFSDDPCRPSDWSGVYPNTKGWEHLPDYLTDLNAMHEAEKALHANQRITFACFLTEPVRNEIYAVMPRDIGYTVCFPAIHATAAQRAGAFLRAIGKWDDSK